MINSIFITGASGFIGRHLLAKLGCQQFDHVYCLTRTDINIRKCAPEKNVHWLVGSVFDSAIYNKHLDSVDAVIHLAATTGKAQRDQYFTMNAIGTQYLLDQCRRCGVKNFLYVSSIAVKYKDKSRYYYAQSKQEGEAAVIKSGLNYAIVRPTIVLGKESPSWKALSAVARLRVIPVLGDGTARIQPVDVDDLVDAVISVIEEQDFLNESFDLGGPDVLTIEELLVNIHRLYCHAEPRVVHIPYQPVKGVLSLAGYFSSMLPLNAGQLSVFVQDGTIATNRLYTQRRHRMKNIDTVLRLLVQ